MSRYIDADKLKERIPKDIHEDVFENCSNCELLDDEQVKELIDLQPTADVRENVRGEWIEVLIDTYGGGHFTYSKCSVCQSEQIIDSNFCPNCGADMRGDT